MDIRPEDIPPTHYELEEARHALVRKQDAARERLRLRRSNQAKGFREPRPGDKLHVQLDNTIPRRSRAGLRFERGPRYTVEIVHVVDDPETSSLKDGAMLVMTPDELKANQAAGRHFVDVVGAELLLDDAAFHKFQVPMSDDDIEALKRSNADQQRKLSDQSAELAAMRAELATLRAARAAAPDSKSGRPDRLNAQRAAREAAAAAGAAAADAVSSASTAAGEADHTQFGAQPDEK